MHNTKKIHTSFSNFPPVYTYTSASSQDGVVRWSGYVPCPPGEHVPRLPQRTGRHRPDLQVLVRYNDDDDNDHDDEDDDDCGDDDYDDCDDDDDDDDDDEDDDND